MIRRPPRSTLFPYTDALPISIVITSSKRWLTKRTADPRRAISRTAENNFFTDGPGRNAVGRSEEHTSELQSQFHLVCRLLLEKKKKKKNKIRTLIQKDEQTSK